VTVSREGYPSQSFGHNRRSAAASLQVELRNLGGNKLSDQPEEEPKYQCFNGLSETLWATSTSGGKK
jgi:hypothetical protein